jgi:hypothetical protein
LRGGGGDGGDWIGSEEVPEDRIQGWGLWEAEKGEGEKVGPTVWRGDGGPPEMEVEMGNLEEYAK